MNLIAAVSDAATPDALAFDVTVVPLRTIAMFAPLRYMATACGGPGSASPCSQVPTGPAVVDDIEYDGGVGNQ